MDGHVCKSEDGSFIEQRLVIYVHIVCKLPDAKELLISRRASDLRLLLCGIHDWLVRCRNLPGRSRVCARTWQGCRHHARARMCLQPVSNTVCPSFRCLFHLDFPLLCRLRCSIFDMHVVDVKELTKRADRMEEVLAYGRQHVIVWRVILEVEPDRCNAAKT